MIIISGDPGSMGAFAVFKNRKLKDVLPAVALWPYAREFPQTVDAIALEDVHGFQGQGAKRTFSFGHEAGKMEAYFSILAKNGTFPRMYAPQRWQKEFGVPRALKGEGNVAARKRWIWEEVKKLYPGVKIPLYAADAVAIGDVYIKLEKSNYE